MIAVSQAYRLGHGLSRPRFDKAVSPALHCPNMARKAKEWWVVLDGNPRDGWYGVTWESGEARVRLDSASMITDVWIEKPTPEKLRRVPLSRIEIAASAGGGAGRRYRLRRPASRRLTDAFYAKVAFAYTDAAGRGNRKPRKVLADDTGAADATVARWIMEARKRGYLPPAQPGKVSV